MKHLYVTKFSQWSIRQITIPVLRTRIADAKAIFKRECSLDYDLKEMADPSFVYSTGVESGMLEGTLIRLPPWAMELS